MAMAQCNKLEIIYLKLIIIMTQNKYKYTSIKSPQQLGFLEYHMLPQKDQFQYVYRPGDDSFIMLSVLKQQLKQFPSYPVICQVGSGSGILSAHLSKWLKQSNNQPTLHLATDINIDACLLSQKYYEKYNLNVQQVCTSLLKGCRVQPQIIVCNPPYVLTDPQQRESQHKYLVKKLQSVKNNKVQRTPNQNLIAYSYMGGPDGLEITRQLINYISWQTRLYLIIMGEQGIQTLQQQIYKGKIIKQGFKGSLQILQFAKKTNQQLFFVLVSINKV